MNSSSLLLPIQVTGRADVGRLLREVEQIDNFLKQASIRQPGTPLKMPKTSRLLDDFANTNKVNLLQADDRAMVLNFLITVKSKAPVLHMSFSVDPAPTFVEKLTTWLRKEIHPMVLLQVGLQPNIGAGCVVRSTNKYFDFSLRAHFKKQKPLLMQKLQGEMKKTEAEAPAPSQVEQPEPPAETAPEQPSAPPVSPAVTTETPSHQEAPHA